MAIRHRFRARHAALVAQDSLLLGGLIARCSYRLGLHGKLAVTTHEIRITAQRRLPAPLVLAFASDFHAGPVTDPALFTDLMDAVTQRQPDVLLLGGDYVSSRAHHADVFARCLARYRAPLGTYAVLGNHDLWSDSDRVTRSLRDVGVVVLVNQNCTLSPPFDCVSVCGLDDPWAGQADAAATFKDAAAIRIFLTHSPDGMLLLDEEQYHVGFAGHTHGGQIALRDGTQLVTAGGPLSRTYGRGRFSIPGNGPLLVSRGVGCTYIPVRINSEPELMICTLLP
jgi:predicted MPP superfamily phosphohydrolase